MLRLQDVRALNDQLKVEGELGPAGAPSFLKEVTTWFGALPTPLPLDEQAFAELCEVIRADDSPLEAAQVARGALVLIRNHAAPHRELAHFIARFALDRIAAIRGRPRRWNSVFISDTEFRNAGELFEVAKSDDKYSDDTLVSASLVFVQKHRGSSDMYGRFAQDLERLTTVLRDADAPPEQKVIARGALVYFVESSDAISDAFGPVGLLDDAIVVARALSKIYPDRIVLAAFLDDLVARWPFLLDLAFEFDDEAYQLSEYLIINAALALQNTAVREAKGAVVILDDPGPLPYLIGFLTAIAEIFTSSSVDAEVDFQTGERLVNPTTQEEYVFVGYVSDDYQPTTRVQARYFKVRQNQKRRVAGKPGAGSKTPGEVTFFKPIEHLAALQPSGRRAAPVKKAAGDIDINRVQLGALERLFARIMPVRIPDDLGQVVVVAPLGRCQDLGRSLSIFGTPILEIVPTGTAHFDDGIELLRWSRTVAGRTQVITVVRTVAEALELVESAEHRVRAVVVTIKPETTDAANAKSIAQRGVHILAIAEERDSSSHEVFEREGFRFWAWQRQWLDHLHWPAAQRHRMRHPLVEYESNVRTRNSARVQIVDISDAPVERAYEELKRFEATANKDDEAQSSAVASAYHSFVVILRELSNSLPDDGALFTTFRGYLQGSVNQWPDRTLRAGRDALDALILAAAQVRRTNGKLSFLRSWAERNPNGIVVASNRARASLLSNEGALTSLRWTNVLKHASIQDAVLVTAWQARTTEGLLFPPVASAMTVALYGPERLWLEAARARRSRVRNKLVQLSRGQSALPRTTPLAVPPSTVEPVQREEAPAIEQMITAHRRQRALSTDSQDFADVVEARLVYFVGGYWAAFSPEARIHTFTHLLEDESAVELPLRPVGELQAGDRVMMVRGSGRDVVAVTADRYLPPGARTTAGLWQQALRRYVEERTSISALHHALSQAGCQRTIQTIRGWVTDEYRIGPQEPVEKVLEAIVNVTGDESLQQRLDDCVTSIRQVRSAHVTAGHELQQQVLKRVRQWLDSGVSPDEVLEVEEQVVLLTVESVDPQLASVPRAKLNQLREEA